MFSLYEQYCAEERGKGSVPELLIVSRNLVDRRAKKMDVAVRKATARFQLSASARLHLLGDAWRN